MGSKKGDGGQKVGSLALWGGFVFVRGAENAEDEFQGKWLETR